MTKSALLVVDVQNDFLPGGALAVPHGDEVVPVVNRVMPRFDLVVATQDWHPPDHGSFAANHPGKWPGERIQLAGLEQILWPVHCVQGSQGAQFAPGLNTAPFERVFHKGTDPELDSYSAIFDNAHRKSTGLAEFLKERGVDRLYIAGLATDYCVRYTGLDARQLGFDTYVIADACRGVDLQPGDSAKALDELRERGAHIIQSEYLLAPHASG